MDKSQLNKFVNGLFAEATTRLKNIAVGVSRTLIDNANKNNADLVAALEKQSNKDVVEAIKESSKATEKMAQAISDIEVHIPPMEMPEMPQIPDTFNVSLKGISTIAIKGDKGDKGDKGEPGRDGKNGKDGKDGKPGKDGLNGLDGVGKDGVDGKDGKDGSPDTPEQIVEKLESLEGEERLDAKAIKNLPQFVQKNMPSGGMGAIKEIVAGTNVTVDKSNLGYPVINATGGEVSDEAYGAGWDGETAVAPSKNAVYDKIQSLSLGSGTGDVVGPASAVADNFVAFDGTTGKLVKDSGRKHSDYAPASHTHTASQITDFDTEVGNNTDVAANTLARHTHANQTVLDNTTASFTTADETKLDGIAAGAEVNVNADWNAVSGDAQILNKPTISGTNTGDQTSIVGITGTKAQFDTAVTDGNFMYVGDAPTAHTHTLATGATDVTASAAELNVLDGITASTAELNYTDGVTSAIQTQLDARLPLAGGTMTGKITLGENASIGLDPAGSADGVFTGITITGTAGATLAFGDLIYLDPTDSRWELADANAGAAADGDARGVLGICVQAAAADGNATTILLHGVVRADTAFPAMTINNPMYVSETAGDITGTQPTTADVVIRIVGHALTADELYFHPDNSWITHT